MLAFDARTLGGRGRDVAIPHVAGHEQVPQRVGLQQYHFLVAALVAGEAVDDADIECFAQELIDKRVLLIHVGREGKAGVDHFVTERNLDRAIVHGADRERDGLLLFRLVAELHAERDHGGRGLRTAGQAIVIKLDLREDTVRRFSVRQHAGERAGLEILGALQRNTDRRIRRRRFYGHAQQARRIAEMLFRDGRIAMTNRRRGDDVRRKQLLVPAGNRREFSPRRSGGQTEEEDAGRQGR